MGTIIAAILISAGIIWFIIELLNLAAEAFDD